MPYNMEDALLSSPDPLLESPNLSSPIKLRSCKVKKCLSVQGSSPRKQTFELDVGDQLSPHKIRVTVEAEQSDIQNAHGSHAPGHFRLPVPPRAPAVRQNIRTKTTTIPVKGLSDSEDEQPDSIAQTPKRGRGRPRKSTGTPLPSKSKNRISTPGAEPNRRRRRTLGDLVDGDDEEDWDFAIGAGVELKRGKGRSRSRSVKEKTRKKATTAAKRNEQPNEEVFSSTSGNGQGRRKTLTPKDILILEDEVDAASNRIFEDVNREREETGGALAPRNINVMSTEPAFSTIRSTTTVADDEPDVLLVKFSPAKKTSVKTGWSSPNTSHDIEPQILSSAQPCIAVQPQSVEVDSDRSSVVDTSADRQDFEAEADDTVGEFREFDTILQSEGFSMISVDAVPSLREHLSSSPGRSPTNDDCGPARDSGNASSVTAKKPKPTTRALMLSGLNIKDDLREENDSFSCIAADVLEQATPGRHPINNRHLSVRPRENTVNDSFSSIPSAILEDASPIKNSHSETQKTVAQSEIGTDPRVMHSLLTVPAPDGLDFNKRDSTGSRLMTPDETPSPPSEAPRPHANISHISDADAFKADQNGAPTTEEPSMISSHMRSSPPPVLPRRFTYTAHLRQHRVLHPDVTRTPSVVFSSPSLPPLIQPVPPPKNRNLGSGNIDGCPKKSMSTIVHAGRVLQDITLPTSSRNRTQSLGSPFKSPMSTRNSDTASDDIIRVDEPGSAFQKTLQNIITGDIKQNFGRITQQDDPFTSGSKHCYPLSPKERTPYSLEVPNQEGPLYPKLGLGIHAASDTIRSDSVMSWQPEATVPAGTTSIIQDQTAAGLTESHDQSHGVHDTEARNLENTQLFIKQREAEWARERAAVSSQIESASTSQVIVIDTDSDQSCVSSHGGMNEDIWQLEARHSSSLLEEQEHKDPAKQEIVDKPRRSKIPSPWRKNSKRLVYSDELVRSSSMLPIENPKSIPPLLPARVAPIPAPVRVWKHLPVRSAVEEEDGDEEMEESIVWHIPQKSNFAPKPANRANLDLSVLLGSSPAKVPPPTTFQPFGAPRFSLFGPRAGRKDTPEQPPRHGSQGGTGDACEASSVGEDLVDSAEISYASDSGSQTAMDASQAEESTQNPSVVVPRAESPLKSCLRSPESTAPIKSVAFAANKPPRQPLSGKKWSKAHWALLQKIYRDAKPLHRDPTYLAEEPREEIQESRLWGTEISGDGITIGLEKWHLDIVWWFIDEVPGWEEHIIARRLWALIGCEMRRVLGVLPSRPEHK